MGRLWRQAYSAEWLNGTVTFCFNIGIKSVSEQLFQDLWLPRSFVNHGPNGKHISDNVAIRIAYIEAAVGEVTVIAANPGGNGIFLA